MSPIQLFDFATPGIVIGMLAGGIVVLILIILLISLIEAVILTLLGWDYFRKSLIVSTIMNIASGIIGGILLVLVPHPTILGLIIAMILSIIIEGGIMMRFRSDVVGKTFLLVFLANLCSYAVVIFPAYFYSQT